MTEHYYVCEKCSRAIDRDDFLKLSNDRRYTSDKAFIFHSICAIDENREGREVKVLASAGNLVLVEKVE